MLDGDSVFFKQKTAYEVRISDWSSDVCSSDLHRQRAQHRPHARRGARPGGRGGAGMSVADWKLRAGQGQGQLIAVAVFLAMFTLYIANHPAGLTVPVATPAANKAVLLALVAMAPTLPVLPGGLPPSVGMVSVMPTSPAPPP